ncbi:hypothetical protein LINPERHAP1_LOCUS36941, partial [Linum perenne]
MGRRSNGQTKQGPQRPTGISIRPAGDQHEQPRSLPSPSSRRRIQARYKRRRRLSYFGPRVSGTTDRTRRIRRF